MALPFADVHEAMLAEFGETALVRQQGQAEQEVRVVWKMRAFQVDAEGGATASSSEPVVALPEGGLPQPVAPGDVFVIRGTPYQVWDVERTGEGWARCSVHKVVAA